MSTFAAVPQLPPDAIFNMKNRYVADADARKVNLTVGAYATAEGRELVLDEVRRTEGEIVADPNLTHSNFLRDNLVIAHLARYDVSRYDVSSYHFAILKCVGRMAFRMDHHTLSDSGIKSRNVGLQPVGVEINVNATRMRLRIGYFTFMMFDRINSPHQTCLDP